MGSKKVVHTPENLRFSSVPCTSSKSVKGCVCCNTKYCTKCKTLVPLAALGDSLSANLANRLFYTMVNTARVIVCGNCLESMSILTSRRELGIRLRTSLNNTLRKTTIEVLKRELYAESK